MSQRILVYIIGKGYYNYSGIGSMLIMYCCQVNYSKTSHQIKTMDVSPSHRPKIRNIKACQLSEFGQEYNQLKVAEKNLLASSLSGLLLGLWLSLIIG